MPLYEYKCHGCGKTFEVIQKFSDEPLKTHVECGGDLERLLSAPALQFKGSGWYVTDYAGKNGGSKPEGKSDSGDKKSESNASGETKSAPAPTESKPASTSSTTSESK